MVVAVAAEILAATAGLLSTALPTPRRQEAVKDKTNPPIPKEHVVGIGCLETKVSNAARIVLVSKPFRPTKIRETAKGAGVCERGDPLLLIINKK